MHELMSVPTSMLGPINQRTDTATRNLVANEGNTGPMIFLIENQRPPLMVANEIPTIPHQNQFNMLFNGDCKGISKLLPREKS